MIAGVKLNEADQEYELGQLILPMSIDRFFDEFISDKATFGFDLFSKDDMGNTEIDFENLTESKDKKHKFPIFTRKMNCIVPISGVPFCSQSAMTKTFKVSRPRP